MITSSSIPGIHFWFLGCSGRRLEIQEEWICAILAPICSPMALAHASPSFCFPVHTHYVCVIRSGTQSHTVGGHTRSNFSLRSVFTTGHPLRRSICQRSIVGKATKISIRCEQSSQKGNGVDVWLGRLAMVGFAFALSVEIGTGKGVLENLGLTAPLPTLALAITFLVGVLAAIFIFQSASKD